MAGPDLPFGGSGGTSPPPGTPLTSGDDDAGPPSSLPRRSTRISASASARQDVDEAVDGTVRLARRAAAGSLRSTTTRGRDHADVERMREVILEVRQAPSVPVPADDADSPYPKKQKIHRSGTRSSGRVACQISYLSSSSKKRVGTDPVMHLASVPEWQNAPSEEDTADYKAETLQKLGTIVCPLNMDISSTDEPEKTRKERVDKCNCSHPGSEDCVRVHVKKARSWIKDQLGEETFGNCGLDAMGEHVRELWTAKDKRKLDNIDKLIPQKKHKKFMKIALKQLSRKKTKDLAKYYYNVFLPRRLASLTRAEPKKDEDVDTDEDDSNPDDDNNGHRSRKKSKSSGSSSKRVAEILAEVSEKVKTLFRKVPAPDRPGVPLSLPLRSSGEREEKEGCGIADPEAGPSQRDETTRPTEGNSERADESPQGGLGPSSSTAELPFLREVEALPSRRKRAVSLKRAGEILPPVPEQLAAHRRKLSVSRLIPSRNPISRMAPPSPSKEQPMATQPGGESSAEDDPLALLGPLVKRAQERWSSVCGEVCELRDQSTRLSDALSQEKARASSTEEDLARMADCLESVLRTVGVPLQATANSRDRLAELERAAHDFSGRSCMPDA